MRALGWGRPLYVAGAADFHGVIAIHPSVYATCFRTACRGSWSAGKLDSYVLYPATFVDENTRFPAEEMPSLFREHDRACAACLAELGADNRKRITVGTARIVPVRGAA